VPTVDELRGQGRWAEALAQVGDPLERADLLNEQALFQGSSEARAGAQRELDRAEARLLLQRARVLHATFLADRVEDPHELELCHRASELAGRVAEPALEAEALFWLGIGYQVVRGDHETSRPYFEESYRLAKELGSRRLQSYAVRHLGFVFDADGHRDRAWDAFEESVRLRREEGFLPGVAAGLLTLGETAIEQGDPERARPLLEEARELAQLTGAEPFLRRIDEALESLP
jgi:tetratricopeptide (TPR) repeat protein